MLLCFKILSLFPEGNLSSILDTDLHFQPWDESLFVFVCVTGAVFWPCSLTSTATPPSSSMAIRRQARVTWCRFCWGNLRWELDLIHGEWILRKSNYASKKLLLFPLKLPHAAVSCVECVSAALLFEHVLRSFFGDDAASLLPRSPSLSDFVRVYRQQCSQSPAKQTRYIVSAPTWNQPWNAMSNIGPDVKII